MLIQVLPFNHSFRNLVKKNILSLSKEILTSQPCTKDKICIWQIQMETQQAQQGTLMYTQ